MMCEQQRNSETWELENFAMNKSWKINQLSFWEKVVLLVDFGMLEAQFGNR